MNVESMLKQLDELFDTGKIKEVEGFLKAKLGEAKAEADGGAVLTILNEQIGYYRVMTQYDKAFDTIEEIEQVLVAMNLSGTISEATSLLNIATVYRAMGKLGDAEDCYQKAERLYEKLLEPTDYRVAGLYNNMSLFYQESESYGKAIECQKKAIAVIEQIEGSLIQQAISYTNLGQTYCKMQSWELAKDALGRAESLFEEAGVVEEHYSGFASAMGYYHVNCKEYELAIAYYEKALLNSYQTSGVTKNFKQIQTDLQNVYKLAGKEIYDSMLDVCQAYYEQVGKPMIHEQFAAYEDKIAVGLCGEGSECFGMEDTISLDHDCGPGFAMWLDDETYALIGKELQKAYEALPKVFMGYIRNDSAMGQGRCGVCSIDGFFERVLGKNKLPSSDTDWRAVEETALCTATNGRVFVDPAGMFTEKRELLCAYYPRHIWLEKLAKKLIYSAQTGQYNYGRMMARGEYVAANIALSEYMQSTMQVVYMLNKKYTPYYKWLRVGMKDLAILPEVGDIMEAICDMPSQRQAWEGFGYNGNPNPNDMIAGAIEIVAKLITDQLNQMGLSDSMDPYLEIQGKEVLKRV